MGLSSWPQSPLDLGERALLGALSKGLVLAPVQGAVLGSFALLWPSRGVPNQSLSNFWAKNEIQCI